MLKRLIIQNIALIDSAEICFTNGLNVLSGETGSGKSVIIDSLNFVLGAKADKSLIRSGQFECFVKAEFDISTKNNVKTILSDFDIDVDDIIIISRKFNLDGKSTIKINGESVTASMLKKITTLLVDVHGQSEHFNLLNPANQLKLIDKFGGEKISLLKNELSKEFSKYKSVCEQISELGGDESQRLTRLDILNYQINEIETCNIQENEENELLEIKTKLSHQEKILSALSVVKSTISEENGAVDLISNAVRALSSITDFSSEYSTLYERLDTVFSELDDISDCADNLANSFDFSEYNADQIEHRLETIKTIKKKYGGDLDAVFQFLENARIEKDKLERFSDLSEKLLIEKENLENVVYKIYKDLSELRRDCAKKLSKNVVLELKELGMPKGDFQINFNEIPTKEDCKFDSSNGIDIPEFTFSANLGEPLKNLSSVISGGEMSRFMLAIKSQTAKYNEISTFIFDEIDAGISGLIAKIVAEKFIKIANDVQIIAITHLPQISAMADNNLLISKIETDSKTTTQVKQLNAEEKIKEITRLIGGDFNSESAKKHSEELIKTANDYKNIIKNKLPN